MEDTYRIKAVGDCALTVEFDNVISEEVNQKVAQLQDGLINEKIPGVGPLIPTYRALLIQYDPMLMDYSQLSLVLVKMLGKASSHKKSSSKLYLIPVCYEVSYGPDLETVAKNCGLSSEDVVIKHSERDYRIYMLGFTPGFPYLGGMNEALETPRLAQPRVKIHAGSVGIAGKQTGIYPIDSPGGWQIIGRTPLPLFNQERQPSILLEAGAYIRFIPIDALSYKEIEAEVAAGTYTCEIREKLQGGA